MTDSSKIKLLSIALTISIGVIVFDRFSFSCPEHCNDAGRYSTREQALGGTDIPATSAAEFVESYRQAHLGDRTPYFITGFMLSKRVFDGIFNAPTLNAITMDLYVDETQNLSVIVKGITTDKTAITTTYNSGIYINQSMCPSDCARY